MADTDRSGPDGSASSTASARRRILAQVQSLGKSSGIALEAIGRSMKVGLTKTIFRSVPGSAFVSDPEQVRDRELIAVKMRREVYGIAPLEPPDVFPSPPPDIPPTSSGSAIGGNGAKFLIREPGHPPGDLDSSVWPLRGNELFGLALSGGGIRSATFGLGIMQCLAARKLLRHVDYLSTVSGGGYIGSSLTWFANGNSGQNFGVDADAGPRPFPYGTSSAKRDHPAIPDARLTFLRERGKYLAPGNGLTILSGVGVALRGILLNQIVLIPAAVIVGIFLHLVARWLMWPIFPEADFLHEKLLEYVCPFMPGKQSKCDITSPLLSLIFYLALALALLAGFGVASLFYSFATFVSPHGRGARRYLERRQFERACSYVLPVVAAGLLVGTLPIVDYFLGTQIEKVGIGAFLLGIGSGVWAFAKSAATADGKKGIPISVVARVAGALFLYGFVLIVYQISGWSLEVIALILQMVAGWSIDVVGNIFGFIPPENHAIPAWCAVVTILGAATALASGWFVNVNLISLHRFYRDRLMEAFLPDSANAPPFCSAIEPGGAARAADMGYLKDMAGARGPYHLINANLVTVDSTRRKLRTRGGENFILSPMYCGSTTTNWMSTDEFVGGDMTLATAMAISGAAANPNAGSGGVGATRDRVLSVVMTMLNIRLGYWVPRPEEKWRTRLPPNHYWPAATHVIFGHNFRETDPWLQLSDGGHFDNTALYELFRRRCRLIVACDGSADPDYQFADLNLVLQRAYDDFDVVVKLTTSRPLSGLVPSEKAGYPPGIELAKRGYAIAEITYKDRSKGVLIYLTTTLTERVTASVLGYKTNNPSFPDQSTADQFFDDQQFEAYRELGWVIAEEMLDDTGLRSP